MLTWLVALAAGLGVAAVQYGRSAITGRSASLALLRVVSATLIVALMLAAPAGRASPPSALVALDVSESWMRASDGSAWRAAIDSTSRIGGDKYSRFGDSVRANAGTSAPLDHASNVRALVDAAAGSGRPVVIITDGELDEASALASLPKGSRTLVISRAEGADAAVTAMDAPRALLSGDTLSVRVTLASGTAGSGAGRAELLLDDVLLDTAALPAMSASSERAIVLKGVIAGKERGAVLRAIVRSASDRESRNDTLALGVDISGAPSAVFVSSAPDYDAREAVGALRGVTSLPTRAFYRVAPGMWRTDGALMRVGEAEVRAAVKDAPMVVIHGDTTVFGAPRAATRGALLLFAPPSADDGEYFAFAAPSSPLAPLLAPIAYDSLPPLSVSNALPVGDWQGLLARRGGTPDDKRVALVGWDTPRHIAVLGASGFWRWRFRGGVRSDAYAALFGALFDWLAAGRTDRRAALPDAQVVRAGEPIRWRRGAPGDSDVVVTLSRRGRSAAPDSLRLSFAGTVTTISAPLPAGVYDVTTRGGSSVLAVNPSREWMPRATRIKSGAVGKEPSAGDAPTVRDYSWLYALVVLLLCGEWLLRRNAGLR